MILLGQNQIILDMLREEWQSGTHSEHLQHIEEAMIAITASKRDEIEKKYGVQYTELL